MVHESPDELNRRMVDDLGAPPHWRAALLAVPRHRFAPPVVWVRGETGGLRLLRRADDPATWLRAVYADDALVTQVDDGAVVPGPRHDHMATSSASQPRVVLAMLVALDPRPGHTVCEIGTGTGWNAALLAHHVGAANVTTIEVDATLAARARRLLPGLTVVTGDGVLGCRERAPFDRVVATAAVRDIPFAWIAQTRPGGTVLLPWTTSFFPGGLLTLTVDADGRAASGGVADPVLFMSLRAQRERPLPPDPRAAATVASRATIEPDTVVRDPATAFAIGARVPSCATAVDAAGSVRLFDAATGSWARVDRDGRVAQHGPRALWDEVEAAHRAGVPPLAAWVVRVDHAGTSVTLP